MVATKARGQGHVPRPLAVRPPLVGTLPITPTTPTGTDPVPPTPVPSCPGAIGVTEGEFYTRPSRTTACPGAIAVQLRNAGEDPHDLTVVDSDTGTIVAQWDVAPPGTTAPLKHLTLSAGSYGLFCTLSSNVKTHDELGMHAVITVG